MQDHNPITRASGLLNTKEAAIYLGISTHALNNWRSSGGGPRFVHLGTRAVRYRIVDLDNFVSAPVCSTSERKAVQGSDNSMQAE